MITYKKAGVDIRKGEQLVARIKKMAPRIGGFSDGIDLPKGLKQPVVVGCTDGVGTKLAIAQKLNRHHTIGIDLVGMNVNDLICSGARPLFFLDYFACGKLNVGTAAQVVKGIVRACRESDCALLGGETAEMPGFYQPGEYDLAGFAAGVVEKKKKLAPKRTVRVGDRLIGLPSSGPHSNGYSLIRTVFSQSEWRRWAGPLMAPTRLYVRPVLRLLHRLNRGAHPPVKGLVHITGGGFPGNIPRILPSGFRARIDRSAWRVPPIFREIQRRADLSDAEMFATFNMGIGLIGVIAPSAERSARRLLTGARTIGVIEKGAGGVVYD